MLILVAWSAQARASSGRYNTSATRLRGARNVHLVQHTHDDPGWLKTVDQYHYGSNNSIQVAGVQYILDSVMSSLDRHPDRTFIFAEMAFFSRWWREQDRAMRSLVRRLIKGGQLSFVNGGYVQNDEAASYYVAMIDQTTLGHRFLKDMFGGDVVPRVGWQIDPFGHSSTQAAFSALYGYDVQFFGRADYQDMKRRKERKEMEMLWRGAASFGDAADVLTGNFASGNYGPPPGFNWDWGQHDPQIQDDERLHDHNVDNRVDAFVKQCDALFNVTRGNDIMLTMGTDFTYANAHVWYKNLDKLIHYVNKDGRLNVFYSSPQAYVRAKHAYKAEWPLKTDDFFPYADCPHCYWTGYFTSRPAAKGYIRHASAYLQAARQLEAQAGRGAAKGANTDALWEAVSLAQHHDAVTGTAKQHVADDYNQRIAAGMAEAGRVVLAALGPLVELRRGTMLSVPGGDDGVNKMSDSTGRNERHVIDRHPSAAMGDGQSVENITSPESISHADSTSTPTCGGSGGSSLGCYNEWLLCPLANISVCAPTVESTRAGTGFTVAVYNPLARARTHHLRIPISVGAVEEGKVGADEANVGAEAQRKVKSRRLWTVQDHLGTPAKAQLLPISDATRRLQAAASADGTVVSRSAIADAELAFSVDLPPLGLSIFDIQTTSESDPTAAEHTEAASLAVGHDSMMRLDSGGAAPMLQFSGGRLQRAAVRGGAVDVKLDAGIMVYNSSAGGSDGSIPSGAYIFRPNGSEFLNLEAAAVVKGPVLNEVRSSFHPWVQLTVRTWTNAPHIEVEWTIGPIPFDDGFGREVVVQYGTDLNTTTEFSTDSNGREMLERVRDFRPTWKLNNTGDAASSNYYPLTTAIEIAEPGRAALAVLVDRAQGGTSLQSGQVEVMIHRRVLHDDWRGVGEPLNETACGCRDCGCDGLIVRGTHLLTLEEPAKAAEIRRRTQQEVCDAPLVAYLPHASTRRWGGAATATTQDESRKEDVLPDNVHLLTFQDVGNDELLLRLAHLYQAGEDPELSKEVEVDVMAVLRRALGPRRYRTVRGIEERSLSGALPLKDVSRLKWKAGASLSAAEDLDAQDQITGVVDARAGNASADRTDTGKSQPGVQGLVADVFDAEDPIAAAKDADEPQAGDVGLAAERHGPVGCSPSLCGQELRAKLGPMEIRTWAVTLGKHSVAVSTS
eukprot:CAMPEP_0206142692 /NCGR_PEP_ID=MMETSP1473-20131121/17914_1 /ASSEMBLY_ACC=CAM_ASM_001109 /TAXON_ID=1461547 /ORGANISM="Stichococcus sp, Strain RCC1054" /LENGTH=1182 /DNA_ID=CAMNT_0053537795 /DNA_START=217 /DNA_END=3765 /DNA_ORIENTATION=+